MSSFISFTQGLSSSFISFSLCWPLEGTGCQEVAVPALEGYSPPGGGCARVGTGTIHLEGLCPAREGRGLLEGCVTTVPLSVSYRGAKPLGPWVRTSNSVPCG